MLDDANDKETDVIEEALRCFVDAYVRGEEPDINEFVAKHPQYEALIRQRVASLREIDALFDSIVQTDASDFEATADQELVGQRVGSFEITKMIGRGGMGVVYLAHDTKLKRAVAIKSIPVKLVSDSRARIRFRREAELLASLNHPNIAVIHEIIEDESKIGYLVLEYIPGETLSKRITREPLTIVEALSIGKQIVEAVSAAHKQGVVHRDLKPGNIKITPDDQIKVLDFGLAKHSIAEAGNTEATVSQHLHLIGTPAYMSPEQARGESTDHRTDIWSFGCILYQMLTGRFPFEGDTATDTLAHIIAHEPNWELLPEETPESIRTLLRRCLEKDPNKRLENIAEANQKINDTLNERNTVPVSAILSRPMRVAMVVTSIFIVALIAMSIGSTFYQPSQPLSGNARLVVLPFDTLGPVEQEWFADCMTDEIATRLGHIYQLDVIWPRSASEFKNIGMSTEIAKKYNLNYVLEGQVQYDRPLDPNSWVRIRIQLYNATDLSQVWQQTYDRDMSDIFTLQTNIAEEVARALDITLRDVKGKAVPYGYRENSEAYACLLQGRQHFHHGSKEGKLKAIEMYEKAIKLDPNYAEAHVLLSNVLLQSFWWYGKNMEFLPRARQAAHRAIFLDREMPSAHVALGRYYYQGCLDYENALMEFTIAIRKNPNAYMAIYWMAMVQRRLGHFDESLDHLLRAAELDPLNPATIYEIATTLHYHRKYEDAEQYYKQAISMAPARTLPYYGMACLYLQWRGDTKQARKAIEEGLLHNKYLLNKMEAIHVLFVADLMDNSYQEALEKLQQQSKDLDNNAWFIPNSLWQAEVYGYLGETVQEKQCYESAVAILEDKVAENPRDDRYRSSLGKAYAGLGRTQEAIEQGLLAVKYLPVDKDVLRGPLRLDGLARIYVMVGQYSDAIDIVQDLLNRDCHLTRPKLRKDPVWDPLRNEPRFQGLLTETK